MKIPSAFRPNKELEANIEDLISDDSIREKSLRAIINGYSYFLEGMKYNRNNTARYLLGLSIAKDIKYTSKGIGLFAEQLDKDATQSSGFYISALVNNIIKEDETITLNLNAVLSGLGAYLRKGCLEINGNFLNNTGYFMQGGCLHIYGNGLNTTGAEMKEGIIVIKGNLNNITGYMMKGGEIKVYGNVREDIGLRMSGGTIRINGGIENFSSNCNGNIYHNGRKIWPKDEIA
ncbi:MAG: hypothetical protein KKA79_10745 [Nanoarchaeota archaeon]|nr:hypothetical protein [Nanoarchaeota archaeon]MCG2717427.1 hypothetical protein [Nanoarchaeota archaeon]